MENEQKIQIFKKELIHDGFCHLVRYTMQHRKFSGEWTGIYTREFLLKPRVAAALPYDPKEDKVVLIEQFRVGAMGEISPWLIEIVAGIMDQNEASLEELLHREMQEEACLKIEALLPICDYLVTPGCSTEKVKLFCAKVDSTQAPEFCGVAAEHEDIRIQVVASKDAFAMVTTGKINNAASIIALQWLELNLDKVRHEWKHF